MIRSIVFPRVLGRSLEELQPGLELLRALGFAAGNQWHEGGSHGLEMLAPNGGVELIAAPDQPSVDAMIEVADADLAYDIVQKFASTGNEIDSKPERPHPGRTGPNGAPTRNGVRTPDGALASSVRITKELGNTSYGARLFEVDASGLRLGFLTYARKTEAHGIEAPLDAKGKRFAVVVARFNSFITERLLDGALLALRQCGADPKNIDVVHVPGSFEVPTAARQIAETGKYSAIVCLGCLLRGDTAHYDVIANETTRGVGQSAQETGVPHGFGVLTCDTLEQAIDRAGLKAGNKGYEAALAAVEMACLRDKVSVLASTAADGGK